MRPAARQSDPHFCPMVEAPGQPPHGPVNVIVGSPTVLIGGQPALRMGDPIGCTGAPNQIVLGSMTVLINGKPAARVQDPTAHGGVLVGGHATVLIGG